ncbi:MAG: hypothetical protein CM15mV7_0410 [uncultured marine virus]|nr:MAG: hypothetical protein CM15mV7_0410 [uncultured marine virus]
MSTHLTVPQAESEGSSNNPNDQLDSMLKDVDTNVTSQHTNSSTFTTANADNGGGGYTGGGGRNNPDNISRVYKKKEGRDTRY